MVDGTDCNDSDPAIHPGAVEECDGDDDNCDGRVDLNVTETWYSDDDGDGFGDANEPAKTCDPDPSWVIVAGDCDPENGNVHPGAPEVCNAFDDDCDGQTLSCGYAGDYSLSDARTKLVGRLNDDAGRLVDAGDLDGDGDQEIVVATLYANTYGGGGYIIDGPPDTGVIDRDDLVEIVGSSDTYGAGRSIGPPRGRGRARGWDFLRAVLAGWQRSVRDLGPIRESIILSTRTRDLRGTRPTQVSPSGA